MFPMLEQHRYDAESTGQLLHKHGKMRHSKRRAATNPTEDQLTRCVKLAKFGSRFPGKSNNP
jgi:hypothetical protein